MRQIIITWIEVIVRGIFFSLELFQMQSRINVVFRICWGFIPEGKNNIKNKSVFRV